MLVRHFALCIGDAFQRKFPKGLPGCRRKASQAIGGCNQLGRYGRRHKILTDYIAIRAKCRASFKSVRKQAGGPTCALSTRSTSAIAPCLASHHSVPVGTKADDEGRCQQTQDRQRLSTVLSMNSLAVLTYDFSTDTFASSSAASLPQLRHYCSTSASLHICLPCNGRTLKGRDFLFRRLGQSAKRKAPCSLVSSALIFSFLIPCEVHLTSELHPFCLSRSNHVRIRLAR